MKTKFALELFALFAILCMARGDMTIQDELVVSVQGSICFIFYTIVKIAYLLNRMRFPVYIPSRAKSIPQKPNK